MSVLVLFCVACGGAPNEADELASEQSQAELRTGGMTKIAVMRGAGFRPSPPPGSCYPAGQWTVDFADARLIGEACIDGRPIQVDRDLTGAELSSIRAKVSALRAAPRPTSCPVDMPVNAIELWRGASSTYYLDQRAACSPLVQAVKEAGLARLVTLLEDLSASSVAPVTCGGIANLQCPSGTACVLPPVYRPDQTGVCMATATSPSACPACEVGFNCNAETATCDPL